MAKLNGFQSHGRRWLGGVAIVAQAFVGFATGQEMSETSLVNPAAGNIAPELVPLPKPQSAAAEGFTREDLEQIALTSNPALARAGAMVGAARGAWVQSGLYPNPSVGYEGQQLGSGGLAEQHGVLFNQEISLGGKLKLNRAVAGRDIDIATQELEAQRLRVLTDVGMSYFQVLVAQEQIQLATELIRVSSEGTTSAEALFKAQEAGRADVLQAQLESEAAQILMQEAKNRYEAAWRGLAAVLGNPGLQPQLVLGDPTAPPANIEFDDALARVISSSPEMTAALSELDRARVALERERVEPIPNVNFQGLVNWQDNGIGGKPDGGVAVMVPIALFNRNQGSIMRAESEIASARMAVAQLELELQNRLTPVFEQYSNSKNQVSRYRETILPAAAESLQLTRQMYQAGETNYLGLLTAQRTFSQTHRNYLEAVLQLRLAEVQIEGLLLSGSLQYRSTAGPTPPPIAAAPNTLPTGLETFRR
jgi:cobalt-zinc-cadmium efflux system outer membrane protein